MNRLIIYPLLSLTLTSCLQSTEVDLIIHNANIVTVDENFSTAGAMAIQGDSIVAIGPEHEIMNKYGAENVVDCGGKFIYPGLIDAHCHFLAYAKLLRQLDLTGTKTVEEMFARVKSFSENNNEEWIIGRGWDQNNWPGGTFPDRKWLDENLPDKKVVLKRIDGHAWLVSGSVLDLAKVNPATMVEGGVVEVRNGNCTGILLDNATEIVSLLLPEPDENEFRKLLESAQENCFAKGITTVADAGLDLDEISLIEKLQGDGSLKMKVYAMLNPTVENFNHYAVNGPFVSRDLTIRSFKFYADGALGSRGAALLEPYSDDKGNRGLILTNPDSLRKFAIRLDDAGFQVNCHAIGDSANRMVLNIYGEILKGLNDKRWRIEHAQVVHKNDLTLFSKFSIIPSIQPSHATSDMKWAADRLGDDRINRAYAYKDLKDQNGMLAFGTDFPVEDIDPLLTLLAAKQRVDRRGQPEGGFQPEQTLSYEDCIRGMTIWAAIANFSEGDRGSLEVGKKADFVVFNGNLSQLNAENLRDYAITSTYVNGVKVYEGMRK